MKPAILRLIAVTVVTAAAMVVPCARAAEHVIEISAFAYSATGTPVQPGDRVTWINRDIVAHTASAADGGWDSGEIPPGGKASLSMPQAFDQDYFCAYHPSMRGRL